MNRRFLALTRAITSLLTVATLAGATAFAQSAAILTPLPDQKYQSWTNEDGAPAGAAVIAQVPDGYLWIGTDVGLFRFDGVSFERLPNFELPGSAGIRNIVVDRRGTVWLSYGNGSLARIDGSRRRIVKPPSDMKRVTAIAVSPDGSLWAAMRGTIYRFNDGRWSAFALPNDPMIERIFATRGGSIWISSDQGGLVLDPRTSAVRTVKGLSLYADVAEDSMGRVWIADAGWLYRVADRAQASKAWFAGRYRLGSEFNAAHPQFDRDGNLWVVSEGHSILRFRAGDIRAEHGKTGGPDRFATPASAPIFQSAGTQDREGSIWLPTELGIARFRRVSVIEHSGGDGPLARSASGVGPVYQVLRDGRGVIYLRKNAAMFRVNPDHAIVPVNTGPMTSDRDEPCPAIRGGFWWHSAERNLTLVDGPNPAHMTIPAPVTGRRHGSVKCSDAAGGSFWFSRSSHAFYLQRGTKWRPIQIDRKSDQYTPFTLSSDAWGNALTYVGYGDTTLVSKSGYKGLVWDPARNPLSFIEAFYSGPRYTLVGGETGLAMVRGRKVSVLSSGAYPIFQDISGIAQTRAGTTWLLGKAGLIGIPTAVLEKRFEDHAAKLTWRLYDYDDGLLGTTQAFGFANLFEAADGVLWMATTKGIFSFDPQRAVANTVAPPIAIEKVNADGRSYSMRELLRFPQGTRNLQIDYTALSLALPKRVQFRYRLQGGSSEAWIDPGQSRQAIFTNLAPGHYTFQVKAANDNGVWNDEGAMLQFIIPSTFLQSVYFKILCGLALLIVGWIAYTVRLAQLRHRDRAAADERERERQRIARELHDTMLQDVQSLILFFHNSAGALPAGDAGRAALLKARDQAENALKEGRSRVQAIRNRNDPVHAIAMVTALAERIIGPSDLELTIHQVGPERLITGSAADAIERIMAESLLNAVRHSGATSVHVEIRSLANELSIGCRDNGAGIPAEAASAAPRSGHFGLVGMRERAEAAGLDLKIESVSPHGTLVRLRAGRRAAFAD